MEHTPLIEDIENLLSDGPKGLYHIQSMFNKSAHLHEYKVDNNITHYIDEAAIIHALQNRDRFIPYTVCAFGFPDIGLSQRKRVGKIINDFIGEGLKTYDEIHEHLENHQPPIEGPVCEYMKDFGIVKWFGQVQRRKEV